MSIARASTKLQDPRPGRAAQELPRATSGGPREHERVTAIVIFIFNRKIFYSERSERLYLRRMGNEIKKGREKNNGRQNRGNWRTRDDRGIIRSPRSLRRRFRPAVDFRVLVAACLKCVNVNCIELLRVASSCCHRRRRCYRHNCSLLFFARLGFLITTIFQRRFYQFLLSDTYREENDIAATHALFSRSLHL